MEYQYILDKLPYKSGFRFVDGISFLDQDKVVGYYTMREDAFFYSDHFPGFPVTPGAIITEIMAQIGLVTLGIYLLTGSGSAEWVYPLLTSVETSFFKMVMPGEKVIVMSNKLYFRFNKLKCKVEMQNAAGETIARGVFAGMIMKQMINRAQ